MSRRIFTTEQAAGLRRTVVLAGATSMYCLAGPARVVGRERDRSTWRQQTERNILELTSQRRDSRDTETLGLNNNSSGAFLINTLTQIVQQSPSNFSLENS